MPRTLSSRINVNLSGQAAASTPHDSADLIDREATAHRGGAVHAPHDIPAGDRSERNVMRYVLALGLEAALPTA
jgi:hypothetical protein